MKVDFRDLSLKERYKIVSRTVIPRPIAWVVTEREGIVNLAPFSYFIPLSSDPPALLISIGEKRDGSPKDSLKNIRLTGRATICMVDRDHLEEMHYTSAPLPEGVSEAEEFGIELEYLFPNFPPIVSGVPAAFSTTLLQEISLGGKTHPLIMEIESAYIDDSHITEEGGIELDLIARIGARYGTISSPIDPPDIPPTPLDRREKRGG
ncbi:MAG: flavin reductase family protein [Epsilonproteobacteria bacterium]|nr:flavin reductase [Campylobacterota bacterium]NPA57020.1 flavin reductase family protein [Campylobacterota bacterium]